MGMISVWRMADEEQIAELVREPAYIEELLDEEGPDLDLDQAWHGIHFMLSGTPRGTAGPRGYLLGGQALGEVNVRYGPARVLSSEEVAIFDDLLQCISTEDFRQRFCPEAMTAAAVYPDIWERALTGEEDALSYLSTHFMQLKQFVSAAHRDGMGVITYFA